MNIGLFFGSFNPIHMGHMIIANMALQQAGVDEIWFIVSPQNPFKKNKNLLHEFDRIDMVRAAIADDFHFKASDIEFNLPKPSYTATTLTILEDKYPQHHFRLIIGEDNLSSFTKWKNYHIILDRFGLIVYPRPNSEKTELTSHENVQMIEAPEIDISATLIRKMIKNDQSIKYLVPDSVNEMIRQKKYFL